MRYSPREADPLFDSVEPVIRGLGMSLVNLTLFRGRKRVQIRIVVYKAGTIGVDDCSRVHHAVLPRLELAFPGEDLYVEVSSPGMDRIVKDGYELHHYVGRGLACYRTDISDWTGGLLQSVDPLGIVLKRGTEMVELPYAVIAKAKLDHSQE
ncbi:MAG: ribosome assembly cofactor RimP [Spirochaetaceae bacterium]|jgi:ribosome maturation factor RimP|nr:ribosome assembly cofactor RimP [Spirochaetaceae bacterium]